MTVQDLLDTLNRMMHDRLIQPNSVVVVRTAGAISMGIELAIEKPAARVVSVEPEPGKVMIKIIGL